MVTTTSSMANRSSLELMLDKLQQKQTQIEEKPQHAPPPLPIRPLSRARARPPRRPEFGRRENRERAGFAESGGGAAAAPALHFLVKTEETVNSKEITENGVCKIQKSYRGYHVRGCYRELRRGAIALQSFIRGENGRSRFEERCRIFRAIIIIQKQGRKYLAAVSQNKDRTRIQHSSLVDLQKRVVRAEAKLRAKKEENIALKTKLFEIEEKWQKREERMASMEKEWQDQLTYIQETLAASKNNPSPQIRFSDRFQNPATSGIPNGGMDSSVQIFNGVEEEDEIGEGQVCLKLRPHEEIRKLKLRFKEWKKEYKNKLRETHSTLKKIGNAETSRSRKSNWWGRGRRSSN